MAVELVLIADSHVPKRARDLPPEVWQAISGADIVFHAGDWVSADLLEAIEARAARLVGVYGNNDGGDLRARLPEVATCAVEGVRFAMVHETGAAQGRERRMDTRFPGVDVLVFGHSHIPWDTVTPAGMRLLNPGSPTDRRRQPEATFMTATVDHGRLADIRLVALPKPT